MTDSLKIPVLALQGLTVRFLGMNEPTLDQVSLHVHKGERVAIVGESGCGKTLTMLSLMNLLPDQARVIEGSLSVDGVMLEQKKWLGPRTHPDLAMIFQQPAAALNPVFRIEDQLRAVARTQNIQKKAELDACRHALEIVRLSDPNRVMRSYPFQLSGGMQQRVMIALALLRNTRVIIADEPGTALDVTIQAEILQLLDELVEHEGLSLLHITHNLGVARETTDRVYVMYGGRVVEHGQTADIFSRPEHPYTIGLLNSVPRLDGTGAGRGIPGNVPPVSEYPTGCRFQGRCPLVNPMCAELPPLPLLSAQEHMVACTRPIDTDAEREALWL